MGLRGFLGSNALGMNEHTIISFLLFFLIFFLFVSTTLCLLKGLLFRLFIAQETELIFFLKDAVKKLPANVQKVTF